MASCVGGLDDSVDVELGKRKCPRERLLGVGGVEHSDDVDQKPESVLEYIEEVGSADMLSEVCEDLRAATSLGSIRGLSSCMLKMGVEA